jgi:hypothetical protein
MTEIINAYMAYTKALQDAKVLVASNRLRPTSAATTGCTVDGQTKVLAKPFAETKGAARRVLPDRGARPRCRARLGEAVPTLRRCRGAAYLGDVTRRPSQLLRVSNFSVPYQ